MSLRYVPVWLSVLLFASPPSPAFPETARPPELRLNGARLLLPPEEELRSLLYAVLPEGRAERGIALSELMPPLAEAWRLEARPAAADGIPAEPTVWTSDDLAEKLDR
jgi:hypothetical protein